MGMTRSFYQVYNRNFTQCEVEGIMKKSSGKKKGERNSAADILIQIVGEETYRKMDETAHAEKQSLDTLFGALANIPTVRHAAILYQHTAQWLPYFDRNICEGYNASHEDVMRLSEQFETPALVLSVYDSDVLFVSYADYAENIFYDYAKPNTEYFEDYDINLYKREFPEFLLDFLPSGQKNALLDVWNAEEIFAEDRMAKIFGLLHATPVFDAVQDGFLPIKQDSLSE